MSVRFNLALARMFFPCRRLRGLGVYLALALPFAGAWLLLPKPYVFSDQASYLLRAIDLQNLADWDLRLVFDYRLGLILPHWVAFKVFGVGYATSFLPQLGFLLLLLFLVLHCCDNLLQKLAAAVVMTALLPYAATVMPDLGLACMMFLALCFLGRRRGAVDGVLFSLAAFYAFLIKTAAGFLVVPYVAVALHSLLRGDDGRGGEVDPPPARRRALPLPRRLPLKGGVIRSNTFFTASVVTGVVLLVGYLAFYHFVYGDALSRFGAINEAGGRHLWNISGADAYIDRLFIAPLPFFYGFLGIAFPLALAQSLITLMRGGGVKTALTTITVLTTSPASSVSTFSPGCCSSSSLLLRW